MKLFSKIKEFLKDLFNVFVYKRQCLELMENNTLLHAENELFRDYIKKLGCIMKEENTKTPDINFDRWVELKTYTFPSFKARYLKPSSQNIDKWLEDLEEGKLSRIDAACNAQILSVDRTAIWENQA